MSMIAVMFTSCSEVDEYGITDTIYTEWFPVREVSATQLDRDINIKCLKAGYKSSGTLSSNSIWKRNGGGDGLYMSYGVGRCLK